MEQLAPNLWTQRFELSLLGGHQGRVVTVIRLASGSLIIHSTAPFRDADVAQIQSLGAPGWLVDSMLRHDTFSKEGRAAFPDIPYLVPEGFADAAALRAQPILPAPAEWAGEVEVLRIDGMPKVEEHVFLHAASRTLIVADLVFNFAPAAGWTSFFRRALMGVKEQPDSARLYPLQVKDRAAYARSISRLFAWDFDRIITGHDRPVPTNGKKLLAEALARKGMMPA
jgi:glyoxylase-like metal-dependent hydrolase (beta-lactamase superfamily II)